jgi:hypothetical protein
MSLNTIASPAARDPGPLVTLVLSRTVENVDSIVIFSPQVDHGCDVGCCVLNTVLHVAA